VLLLALAGASAREELEARSLNSATNVLSAEVEASNRGPIIADAIEPPCRARRVDYTDQATHVIEKISITIPKSRQWTMNKIEALLDPSPNIKDQYKKDFSAAILISYGDGTECSHFAQIRISGDWKDHIRFEGTRVLTSLDVTLRDGNISGVVEFKLLLPETRNGDSEIVTTELFRHLGLIAPLTQNVQVEVNGEQSKMLLQENFSKEMLESQRIRESAMLEVDESLLWRARQNPADETSYALFPRLVNSKWSTLGPSHSAISWEALRTLSRSLAPEHILEISLLSGGSSLARSELARFVALSLALRAEHGLTHHNRRFYFDPLEGGLFPVYYDGQPTFRNGVPSINKTAGFDSGRAFAFGNLSGVSERDIEVLRHDLSKIDLNALLADLAGRGVSIKQEDLNRIVQAIDENLDWLKRFVSNGSTTEWVPEKHAGVNGVALVFGDPELTFEVCDSGLTSCAPLTLNQDEERDLLRSRLERNGLRYVYAGPSKLAYQVGVEPRRSEREVRESAFVDGYEILTLGGVQVEFDLKSKRLHARFETADDRVVIRNGTLSGWKVRVEGPARGKRDLNVRFDENLLTGCVTFIDVVLDEVDVSVNGGLCEDSVNFIRATGTLSGLAVYDADQDAIDADFSDIEMRFVSVKNAGNDCLDLSAGRYEVGDLVASSCSDKAVSVGEGSTVTVDQAFITRSTSAFVAKDSSFLEVKFAELVDINICASAYRKKQEFEGSVILIYESSCPSGVFHAQRGSRIVHDA